MYGLGYDFRSDDYKVVTLSYYATGIDNTPDIFNTSVAVYSVRKGLWRRLLQSKESHWGRLYSNDCAVPDSASGVLVKRALYWSAPNRLRRSPDVANGVFVRGIWENGALHWLASEGSDYSPVIVAFDILEEKFFEVPGPTTVEKGTHVVSKLVALRRRLSILSETEETDTTWTITNTIWTMKDYGIEESWTRYEVKGSDLAELIPFCLMSEDDVVLDACGSLIVYNRREDQWRDIMDDRTPIMLYGAGTRTFRESLVPPTF
ncbi:PREDICTED: F-box/kelch-repeat protein At3g06240-like [Nicotiana attenuata]|uniref:F-box associated beta-propeller type 1 domain-containing protein n=1 Tax=Nicotiana attenuata TaxID=49451 RepID=A0A1J6JIM2_NICAT|nr:PREDICTED: F-box/kelch-repeat protein At3g06240-like [Nicotiana attenuata]OIT06809.1 hypothetical protein A4A49_12144 [Nicotiana attenuata]